MRKRWQLFHATDFQTLMYPCFTFCRILGIFPYKINNSIFETSKLYYILSIVFTCVLCIYELTLHKSNTIVRINFEVVTRSLEDNCYCILTGSIAIVTLVLSSPRMRLLQTMMEISSRLPPESYQKLSKLIHTKDIFGFFYIAGQVFRIFKMRISSMIFSIYTILLVFQMDMLYMNCVCILKACFKEINNNLLRMQKHLMKNNSYPKLISYEQRNPFLIIKLKILKKQHLIISDTVQMLNKIFSLQLLAMILLTFLGIIFTLHNYVVQWHDGLFISLDNHVGELFFIMMYYIIKMALLVWACETGKHQSQKIGTIVHDVLNSTRDEQIKDELQLFSLQILHRENTFSAKGLNMDATLLTKMVGTIATYMLILIQFLSISHSCDGKSAINITKNSIKEDR